MRGGWTSHFTWKTRPEETCLDIFGIAPRGSSPWELHLRGIYADPNVVAEMKRTNRDRDWPFATALGGQMLDEGDAEGWLHLHDPEVMRLWVSVSPPPESLLAFRPLLRLSPFKDVEKIKRLLLAERVVWSELDVIRIRIYQSHLRPYFSALRKVSASRRGISLEESHHLRVDGALQHLPSRPLHDHGLGKMVEEARNNTTLMIGSDVLDWLPAAEHNFTGL